MTGLPGEQNAAAFFADGRGPTSATWPIMRLRSPSSFAIWPDNWMLERMTNRRYRMTIDHKRYELAFAFRRELGPSTFNEAQAAA